MGDLFEQPTSSGKRCPKCHKAALLQSDYKIKCTSCGYELELPKT